MTTKKTRKTEKQFVQFSKKMVVGILAFWGIIRMWSVVAVWLNPDISAGMVSLSYTGNSISEKIATGYYQMKMKTDGKEEEQEDNG